MTAVPTPTPAPAAPSAPRVIPGFKAGAQVDPKTKSRSRPKKLPKQASDAAGAVVADGVATTETAPDASALSAPLVATPAVEEEEVLADKKTAVEAVNKRLRASAKKIQRIVTYEEKTEALNADQQKAIASKPALEATVKELNELLVILKAEEAENDRRQAVITSRLEKRHAQDVASAVGTAKAESQSDVVLLLQFLHLHGLFTESNQGFAPPPLPSAIANATAQDVAAVRCLYDLLSNGPLLGGHGDAIEKISLLASGSPVAIIGETSYARVKELIAGLTSPPAEPAFVPTVESTLPATANDSTTALVDGDANPTATAAPSFLQASELADETPAPAAAIVEEAPVLAAPVQAAAPPAAPHSGWATNGTTAPAPASESAPTLDWSAEDNSGDLPSLEGLAPQAQLPQAVPVPQAPATAPVPVESDGFTAAPGRGGRRGNNGPSFGGERRGSSQGGPSPGAASPAPASTPTEGAAPPTSKW